MEDAILVAQAQADLTRLVEAVEALEREVSDLKGLVVDTAAARDVDEAWAARIRCYDYLAFMGRGE
jgi:hypothetical protein